MSIKTLCSAALVAASLHLSSDEPTDSLPKQPEFYGSAELSNNQQDTISKQLLSPNLASIQLNGVSSHQEPGDEEIDGIRFKNLQVPGGNRKLAALLAPFLYWPLTQGDLDQIKNIIALYYQKNNYPFVAIKIPKQNPAGEVLYLNVIESKLGKVEVKGNKYVAARSISKWIRLQPEETINELTLIRDVNWINTNPFTRAAILYRPGEAPGTTDIDILVTDRRAWRAYVGVDNTGTPLIGRTRWFTGINLNNIFFPRHMLSFQFTTANEFSEFKSYTFQYAAPLPWRHTFSFYGAYASVDPTEPILRSHGRTYQTSGRYTIPHWFSRYAAVDQVSYELGFDFKGTNNNVIFGEDVATPILEQLVWIGQFEGAFNLSRDRNQTKIGAGVEVFWSPCQMLPHQSNEDFNNLRPGATAHYLYGKLFLNFEKTFANKAAFSFMGRLQLSDDNLLPSEQFGLGGYSTVRGYDERVVNGDNAFCANVELKTPPTRLFFKETSKVKDSLFFLLFFDAARGWDKQQIPGLPIAQTLLGVGPGLRYNMYPYVIARCDLGFALHSVVNDSALMRLHFSVVLNY